MRTRIYRSIVFYPVPVTCRGASSCRSGFSFLREPARTGNRIAVRCRRSPLPSGARRQASEQTKPGLSGPLTLHLTVPTDFPHANPVDESPSFFSSSLRPHRPSFFFQPPRTLLILLLVAVVLFLPFHSCLIFNVGSAIEKGRCISCSDR